MKIVIEIPRYIAALCVENNISDPIGIETLIQAVKNGISLPEHHDKLIDEDAISRQAAKKALEDRFIELQKRHSENRYETNFCLNTILELPSVTPQQRTGRWERMSDLSNDVDDRFKCSHCGNIVHYNKVMDLRTFSRWCGRCGSDNG